MINVKIWMDIKDELPREKSAAVASVFSSATSLGMGLPIRLHGIPLGTFLALPLLLAVLSRVVLFDAGEVTESP